ncbi:sentrin-specific protease 1-like [Dendronephthya gigantea]|uniref:sentrin-specific protease 1-like n=1 Tax=Dendronephthya gigantea TaxID=151771 RepID=UPI00106B1A77|nr:sentrin-specific protease 1-like [Dendronephthya gigantea]XP_028413406.1 sentrin-specific protease 1-like [Dendronephthya gigantea]
MAENSKEEIAANINLSLVQVSNNQWLNDEIINFYGNLLQECAQKMPNVSITIKNSFCFTKFKKEEFSNSFARWMDKDSSVLSDLLMFPINEDKHWTLCVCMTCACMD